MGQGEGDGDDGADGDMDDGGHQQNDTGLEPLDSPEWLDRLENHELQLPSLMVFLPFPSHCSILVL